MSEKLYAAAYLIEDQRGWDSWTYYKGGGAPKIPGLGTVKVIDVKEDNRERVGYEYNQGSEGELSITFEVTFDDGEVHYFQKMGSADSYGSESWHGKFIEVRPVEKTVYEYVKA